MAKAEIDVQHELRALQRFAAEERKGVLEAGLPTLSPAQEEQIAAFKKLRSVEDAQALTSTFSLELSMYLTLEGLREVAKSPYHFSSLRNWLSLETWQPKQALLLLAGVCPTAALVDWSYTNFMGAEIDDVRITAATCLNAIHDRYDIPTRDAWDDDITEIRKELRVGGESLNKEKREELERDLANLQSLRNSESIVQRHEELKLRSQILGTLSRHWFASDHDAERRYSPEHFIGWAMARGFTPEWLEWAQSQHLIDSYDEVFRQPFFDPDSEDYPELLHIAVTAWQVVREQTSGTPKQRIEKFLVERYPNLPPTTRELIAQIVNWRRTGGRPKS